MHHRTVCRHIDLPDLLFFDTGFFAELPDLFIQRLHDCPLKVRNPGIRVVVLIGDPCQHVLAKLLLGIQHGRLAQYFSIGESHQIQRRRCRTDIHRNSVALPEFLFKFRNIAGSEHLSFLFCSKKLHLQIFRHLYQAGKPDARLVSGKDSDFTLSTCSVSVAWIVHKKALL